MNEANVFAMDQLQTEVLPWKTKTKRIVLLT